MNMNNHDDDNYSDLSCIFLLVLVLGLFFTIIFHSISY